MMSALGTGRPQTWVVTGGAGYIGGHVVRDLLSHGIRPVVVDDLSTGVSVRVPQGVELHRLGVHETSAFERVLIEHQPQGVIHLAAKKSVPDSMLDPTGYFFENVEGFRSVLEAVRAANVKGVVLSSTAAVYGDVRGSQVGEHAPTRPLNPYGQSKLACEWLLESCARAWGLGAVILRYFNVAGAATPQLADVEGANLIPLVLRALRDGDAPEIYGAQHPTRDGTCVRDFIHVEDLADAHSSATAMINPGETQVWNVSTGRGSSVREVVAESIRVTGANVEPRVVAARTGDAPEVVGDPSRIAEDLGWRHQRDLRDMIASTWQNMP